MKTNRLFLALAFVAVLGGSSAFAQNTDGENSKPADKQRKRPTPEQMMEFQTGKQASEQEIKSITTFLKSLTGKELMN